MCGCQASCQDANCDCAFTPKASKEAKSPKDALRQDSWSFLSVLWDPLNRRTPLFWLVIANYHKVNRDSTSRLVTLWKRGWRQLTLWSLRSLGSHWKWMTSGVFEALEAFGVNGQYNMCCYGSFRVEKVSGSVYPQLVHFTPLISLVCLSLPLSWGKVRHKTTF